MDEFPQKHTVTTSEPLFFLSHAHSDHTQGIANVMKQKDALIVCTPATSRIIRVTEGIPPEKCLLVKPGQILALDGTQIHIVDANHCIGSVMYIFESDNQKEVYTGDFRFNAKMQKQKDLLAFPDICWMDQTFYNPRFVFPSQREAIDQIVQIMIHHSEDDIFLGCYTVGKEKILEIMTKIRKTKIYAPKKLRRVYEALGLDFITEDRSNVSLFAYTSHFLQNPSRKFSKNIMERVLDGVRIFPTGWACINTSRPDDKMYFVPYSEHNDYQRLKGFIKLIQPKKIIPIHSPPKNL